MQKIDVRVYGVCVESDKILLTDEIFRGLKYVCKFPGGGLEYGEGTVECLEREFLEEMGVKVRVGDLLYLNPFFQPSASKENEQVLCIYYWIEFLERPDKVRFTEKKYDFERHEDAEQVFRWVKLSELNPDDLTFKIDKELWKVICQKLAI